MKLDELKEHCLKTLKQTEKFPTKTFEEHALVLRLIENQTSVIEELEKIKAEIKVNARGEYDFEGYCREEKISIKEVNKIIDNHIEKLKGENNE